MLQLVRHSTVTMYSATAQAQGTLTAIQWLQLRAYVAAALLLLQISLMLALPVEGRGQRAAASAADPHSTGSWAHFRFQVSPRANAELVVCGLPAAAASLRCSPWLGRKGDGLRKPARPSTCRPASLLRLCASAARVCPST